MGASSNWEDSSPANWQRGIIPLRLHQIGRSWFSGRIRHCQCRGAGSIPADRSRIRGCSSMAEWESSKLSTTGSIPASRSSFSGCRVTGAHLSWGQGGGGSNPPIPTSFTGSGLVLKAPVSGTGDRGLKSRLPDQIAAWLRSGSSVVSYATQAGSIPVPATILTLVVCSAEL